jgi:hypothetical protein
MLAALKSDAHERKHRHTASPAAMRAALVEFWDLNLNGENGNAAVFH